MFRQSVTSEVTRNISAGPQLQASNAPISSQSIQLCARRAIEWVGTSTSAALERNNSGGDDVRG